MEWFQATSKGAGAAMSLNGSPASLPKRPPPPRWHLLTVNNLVQTTWSRQNLDLVTWPLCSCWRHVAIPIAGQRSRRERGALRRGALAACVGSTWGAPTARVGSTGRGRRAAPSTLLKGRWGTPPRRRSTRRGGRQMSHWQTHLVGEGSLCRTQPVWGRLLQGRLWGRLALRAVGGPPTPMAGNFPGGRTCRFLEVLSV